MRQFVSALVIGAVCSVIGVQGRAFSHEAERLPQSPNVQRRGEDVFHRSPRTGSRKVESKWDHVVKGSDVRVQSTEAGFQKVTGKLDNYSLRAKVVDPSKLGVDKVKQYSGYLDDDETDRHFFYWFFESRNDPKNDPVVLWLTGGPGCSSMTGLLAELGPAHVDKNLKLTSNPYSWNNNASVIFLDQPVNTGFSYSNSPVSTTTAAASDIYALLTIFFHQFPQYGKQDFHIAGESYAGHYIPVSVHEILSHKDRNINLKSAMIGNGLTDPFHQYTAYEPMGCGKGGYPAVLDDQTCKSMQDALPQCQQQIQACYDSNNTATCVQATSFCNQAMLNPYQETGKNVYDVRKPCDGDLCYPVMDYISSYFNQKSVQDALGVEVQDFGTCNYQLNSNFSMAGDWMQPFYRMVPDILEKIPLLIYAGDADFICNWLGNQAWTNALDWPGHNDFNAAKPQSLKIGDGKDYGNVKSAKGLTFMQIYGAGHMVPMDQPAAASNFFNRFIFGEWNH